MISLLLLLINPLLQYISIIVLHLLINAIFILNCNLDSIVFLDNIDHILYHDLLLQSRMYRWYTITSWNILNHKNLTSSLIWTCEEKKILLIIIFHSNLKWSIYYNSVSFPKIIISLFKFFTCFMFDIITFKYQSNLS